MTRSWWRSNRWWLLALPLALVLMLAASSWRIETFWWESGYHRAVASAEVGDFVDVHETGIDGLGDFPRDFRVRLVGVAPVEQFEPRLSATVSELPDGMAAYAVELDFEADPDQVMPHCQIILIDEDGVRYGNDRIDPMGAVYRCSPEAHPGPLGALFADDAREPAAPGTERPPSWTTAPLVLAPAGVRITEVWLGYDHPEFVRFRLTQ